MKNYNTILLSMFILTFFTSLHGQSIRYVESTGTDIGNCTDPSNACATINYAMEMAGSGDVIDIASGVYTEELNITKDLTIQGAGNFLSGGTIIQAHTSPNQATNTVIIIDGNYTIQISDLIIRHGVGNDGGGLYNINANLTLTDVVIRDNTAEYGGGMYNDSGNVTLLNVNFTNNSSIKSGGGLNSYTPNEIIVLNDVVFSDNTAGQAAGGVALYGGFTSFNNVKFENNIAESLDGGGLYASNTIATFTDISFTDNEAQGGGEGGALFIEESTADFINSTFTGNKVAINDGGAVYVLNSSVNFADAIFKENKAAQIGGGIYAFNSDITLLDGLFEDNIAEVGGGFIFASGNLNTALIQNTHFNNNLATEDFGGGLANEGGLVTLINTLFTGNKVAGAGGAIVNAGELHLINNTITQNEATSFGAGGLYNLVGNVTMTNSIVWGNLGFQAPDIVNSNGAVITGHYSLYDDSDVFNEGTFTCNECLTIDPEFSDITTGDFTLSMNSPAIDSGDPTIDVAIFPTDLNGNPIDLANNKRVQNNIIDIGVYEFGTLSTENFVNTTMEIKVTPNPTKDILYIKTEEKLNFITLYSVLGEVLQTWKGQDRINLNTYGKGVYFLKIKTKNQALTKKIIKN